MKIRKTFALLLVGLLVIALAGCHRGTNTSSNNNSTGKKSVKLKVWGAQEDQSLLQKMINSFKDAHKDTNYEITLGVVGEDDAKKKVLEDPKAAADIFSFANDQINDLVKADTLYQITRNLDKIKSENSAGSVEAATVKGKLYAYPMTADNGYFLYYDKSVLTQEDVKTLDGMMAAAKKANKKIVMELTEGWYAASFFLGAGCTVGIDANGKQICDFNNDKGVLAGEAFKTFTAHPSFISGDNSVITGGIGQTICAAVSGTWNAEAIKAKLGDNYAATKLPTFTLGDKQAQMGSFAGYKLMAVNKNTAHPVEAMMLAEWLTNEENQLLRFKERAMGPSNTKAAASEEVQANVALAALAAQSEFATSQKDILGGFWDPLKAFGTAMKNKDYSKPVKEMLDTMVAQMTAG